jgi:hypothetical protein
MLGWMECQEWLWANGQWAIPIHPTSTPTWPPLERTGSDLFSHQRQKTAHKPQKTENKKEQQL